MHEHVGHVRTCYHLRKGKPGKPVIYLCIYLFADRVLNRVAVFFFLNQHQHLKFSPICQYLQIKE